MSLFWGVLGMFFVLAAFILDEFVDKFNQDTIQYNLLNIVGAGLLLYYALILNAWPFIVLNLVWLGAALVKLLTLFKKKKN
ncbi:hypothetical protein HOI26_05235 [Candidatus Woesearchaeota archaeon]|jgi:hypothetical protein|nr:hypothetical protein [Candidatus Woesearchaeota archaeon]MBT5740470.1 hypothetical protein [Candidatus Woesearchaeota archaeon]